MTQPIDYAVRRLMQNHNGRGEALVSERDVRETIERVIEMTRQDIAEAIHEKMRADGYQPTPDEYWGYADAALIARGGEGFMCRARHICSQPSWWDECMSKLRRWKSY